METLMAEPFNLLKDDWVIAIVSAWTSKNEWEMTSYPNREGVGAKIKEQPQTMLVP
jgi:hypothetical protein